MNSYPYNAQNYVRDWLNTLSSQNSLQPVITPNTIEYDISMLYAWGVDGVTLADNTGWQGEYNLLTRKVASAILAPIIQNNYRTASRSDLKAQAANLAPMSYRQYVQYLGCNSPQLLQSVNSINFDQGPNNPGYPFPGAITNNPDPAIYLMNWFRCIYTNYSTGIAYPPTAGFALGGGGAIDATPTNIVQLKLATSAMLRGSTWVAMDYYHTNNTLQVAHPTLFPFLTNSYFISILKDMTARCYPVVDLGATNVSVWAKPLAAQSYAIWAFNESNGVANISVPLSAIGSTNQYWNVFDAFNLTNYSTTQISGSLSLTLAATNGYLLKLTPANTYSGNFIGDMAGGTNFIAANLVGTVPLAQLPTGQGINSLLTNAQQTANIGGSFTIQSSGNALKNAAGGQLIDSAGNVTVPTASITNLAIGVPAGAAAGWVFTLTNTGTGQGTWSNAPTGGGGSSFIPSTNCVVPVYAGADTGINNTNVVLDCSLVSGTNIGAYFFLTVTNPTRLIFSNTVAINPGIGGYIYLSNNAAGGKFVTYTNTVSSLGQLSIAYWTNGSTLNGIGFTVTPGGQIQIKSLDWGIQ